MNRLERARKLITDRNMTGINPDGIVPVIMEDFAAKKVSLATDAILQLIDTSIAELENNFPEDVQDRDDYYETYGQISEAKNLRALIASLGSGEGE